jgi:hypothetical protein
LTAQSILGGHGFTFDWIAPAILATPEYAYCIPERHAHRYSLYPVATGLIAFPFYAVPVKVLGIEHRDLATQLAFARLWEKVAAVFLAASSAGLFLLVLLRVTTVRWAWVLALVFAFGTGVWATNSQALWQHTPGVLCIAGTFYCLLRWWDGPSSRWIAAAGACAGVAAAIRPSSAILCLAVIVALASVRAWKDIAFFCLPGAIILPFLIGYNLSIFGSLRGGYNMAFSGSFLAGFSGLLFSPARGLLVYTPIALFACLGMLQNGARERFMSIVCTLYSVCLIGLSSFWPAWAGGYCWGPRLLTELLPGLVLLIAQGVPRLQQSALLQRGFAVLALWGVFVQGVGVYCYPKGHWDLEPAPFTEARVWDWRDNPISRSLRGGLMWEPYAILWTRVTQGPMPLDELKKRSGIK